MSIRESPTAISNTVIHRLKNKNISLPDIKSFEIAASESGYTIRKIRNDKITTELIFRSILPLQTDKVYCL